MTEQRKSGVGQRTDGRKQMTEQRKSGVGNATSVASKQRGRKSENRGAEDREAENRERAALVMRLQSHLNRAIAAPLELFVYFLCHIVCLGEGG